MFKWENEMKRVLFSVLASSLLVTSWAQEAPSKLTFEDAVRIGLEKNVTLNTQKNQLEATQAFKLSSVGGYLPNVSLNGNAEQKIGQQQNQGTGELEDLNTDYAGFQINASYTIFNGLGRLNGLMSANKQVEAQS